MDTQEWLNRRADSASVAGIARKLWEAGAKIEDLCALCQFDLRQHYLVEALIANGGNQEKAARLLGVHRNVVYRAMHALGLSLADARKLAASVKESD